jgi:protein ImuB
MFAVLHIADFALHAVLRTEPDVAPRAAALFSGTSKKSVVIAANPAARGQGVELGMTAPQAVARCANLIIRAPKPEAEAEARAALLAVGFTFSPSIEDTAPGVCTCDLKRLRTPPEPLASAAVAQLAQLGLPATAGIARTPLLALYAARAALPPIVGACLQAMDEPAVCESPASRLLPQPTEAVLHVADEKNFLTALPLSASDPLPELAAVLHNWGLRTLGDLTALPRDEIVRRFGTEGLALWQRAAGGDMRPLRPFALPQTFSAHMEFEQEIETLEPLLFILRRFLDRLTLELRASQHVAAEIHLALRLEDDTQHARSFRLPEPTADVEILFRALHTHLESLSTAASIVALELRLTPARPLVRQQGLFETGLRDPHGFAETLARVSALVGADRVGTPQLEDTHRPDAVKLIFPTPIVPPPAEPPVHPPLGAPLRRFRPPLPVRLGETEGRTYVWSDSVRGEISSRSSPYSSSGDWWQGDREWARTEWDIMLAEGGVYRLLRVGKDHFIEGEYD